MGETVERTQSKTVLDPTLIEQAKNLLVNDLYEWVADDWQSFVKQQKMGWCSGIAKGTSDFISERHEGTVEQIRGYIDYDVPYLDEEDELCYEGMHEYIAVDGVAYDFAKGTLIEFVDFRNEDGEPDPLFNPLVKQPGRYGHEQSVVVSD